MSVNYLKSVATGKKNPVIKAGQPVDLFEVDTGIDLSLATSIVLAVMKPDDTEYLGATVSLAGTTKISATIPGTETLIEGAYRCEIRPTFPSVGTIPSETARFTVRPAYYE